MQRNHHNQYSRKDCLLHFFFPPPLSCIPVTILPICLKFHEAFNWTNAEQKLDHSGVEKNPALTTHCRNIELIANCAKLHVSISISQDSYYYYDYSAHIQILVNHIYLECSNSCFSSSISLHRQLQAFLLPHNKDVSYK